MLTGENGILTKGETAKNKTIEEEEKEQIKLAYGTVLANKQQNEDKTVSREELEKELKNLNVNVVVIEDENSSIKVTFFKTNNAYIIDNEGKINKLDDSGEIPPVDEIITANDIATDTDKSKYYGAMVTGYTLDTVEGKDYNEAVENWKIFYADNTNIYLIADDYIHANYCPPSKNQTIYKNSDYKLSFNNVILDYPEGSSHITNIKLQNLNSNYFNYLTTNNIKSTNDNMKAVAYMLDTEIWKVFKGEKADYAIGGPTIELLFKSYNEKYGTDYQISVTNINGYEISKDGGNNWADYYEEMLNVKDGLYIIESREKADAMRVSSPSVGYSEWIMRLSYRGAVSYTGVIGENDGFRPIVCLSSGVKLQKVGENIYTIK